MDENALQHADMYAELGIDASRLGCIMLDVEDVQNLLPADSPLRGDGRFTFSPSPHVTLRYGLLAPGPAMQPQVDRVMAGWKNPVSVFVDKVAAFTATDDRGLVPVVLTLKQDADSNAGTALLEAHMRLGFLPHVDVFPHFVPHVTVGFAEPDAVEDVVDALSGTVGMALLVGDVNYGH